MATEVKHIDFKQGWFMAGGIKWTIKDAFTICRDRYFEKFSARIIFGNTLDQINVMLSRAVVAWDKGKDTEGKSLVYNLRENINKKLEDETDSVMRICSLFICEEGEDLTKWDEALANRKTQIWNDEGISKNDFFTLAINLVNSYTQTLDLLSQSSSQDQKTKKSK